MAMPGGQIRRMSILIVLVERANLSVNFIAAEQLPRPPGVFGENEINLGEDLQGTA